MNIAGNISDSDLNRVNSINNPPEFEGGFESESMDDDLNSLFDSIDDGFGSSGGQQSGGFGQPSNGFGSQPSGGFGDTGFGQQSGGFGQPSGGFGGQGGFGQPSGGFGGQPGFGQGGFGQGGFGQPSGGFGQTGFGQPGMNNQQQPAQPDAMDHMIDASMDAAKSLGQIIVEMIKSFNLRTIDDFGYLGRNLTITGTTMSVASLFLGIAGAVGGISILKLGGLSGQTLVAGILSLGTGLVSLGASAYILVGKEDRGGTIENIPDPPQEDNAIDDFENNIGAESDDLFGSDFDDLFSDLDLDDDSSSDTVEPEEEDDFEEIEEGTGAVPQVFNPEGALDNVKENTYLCRQTLFNIFKPLFPEMTPTFANKKTIDKDSDLFLQLQTICLKAIANITNTELEDVTSTLESAVDSMFSYELRVLKPKKKINETELAREVEAYCRSNSEETGVSASVSREGDFYKIVVTKGVMPIVTFGDVFKQQYTCDFFLNDKNKLPVITGIDELGNVILDDAKIFDTMMIAGKPRSGKSWYVLSILMSLMLFNTPEDVQFIIVDPKKSSLFNTMALMPHVCGLHDDSNVLDVMEDIIENEGSRRKKLLSDNRCDDIWALRKKGIKLPILYLVMDEYITIRNNLGDNYKELDKKLQTIISQLPSQGIRVMFVPHRATGIVDKTNRTMIQFSACVRSDISEVTDTLDIKRWDRPLTNPGDIALKTATHPNAMYVRGAALTADDEQNTDFIRTAAKIFYKSGSDLPDMRTMHVAVNRDNDYIRHELQDETERLQFTADVVKNELDNIHDEDISFGKNTSSQQQSSSKFGDDDLDF